MKFIPLLLLLPFGLSGQIILTQSNVPAAGDTLFYARDTTSISGIGNPGPDQIWDFSQLQADETYQLIASDVSTDTNAVNYPEANLIITTEQVKTFIQSSDTAVYILGGGIPEAAAFGLEVVRFMPPQKLYQFPATYGTTFTNFYAVDAQVDGNFIFPGVDSVRAVRRAHATVEIDGYGTVRTPFNSYESLRQKTETQNFDSLYVKYFGAWLPFAADTSISVQYEWLTAESKGTAVTVHIDPETGGIDNIEFFLDVDNASAPISTFTYEDQGQGTLAFTDQSNNDPTTWLWTFGDGGSSQEQNPVYTFTTNGEYQVCLTAGNIFGTNQSCQTITIDQISSTVDPTAFFHTSVRPNPADLHVTIEPQGPSTGRFQFYLYNGLGQVVKQDRFSGQLQLDIHELPGGIYSYWLSAEDGRQWSSGKLFINH